MARDNIQTLKEQLRAQSLDFKKKSALQQKEDEKYKALFEIGKNRIEELKIKLEAREKELLLQKGREQSGVLDDEEPEVIEKEVFVQDPKLVKALNKLRKKNTTLSQELALHKDENQQLEKQKQLLIKEVRKVRKNPDLMKQVKEKVKLMEEKAKNNQEEFARLIEEKDQLIQSYEAVLYSATEDTPANRAKKPSDLIQELKNDLAHLKNDKINLEIELAEAKKTFDKRLTGKIRQLEEEWSEKLKKLRNKKAKLVADIQEESTDSWMITYADMVTLLLTFFILYYSIAAVNMQQFKEAILGEENASIGLLEMLDSAQVKESIQNLTGMKSNDILTDINQVVEDTELDLDTSQAKIVVRVPGNSLFPSASADLQKTGLPALDEVIRIVKKYENYKVHIQGHTDDESISTDRFPTNWELSAARATAVLRYFIDKGIRPEKLTATGYADTFPLASNNTELGRRKNRRVEFVLEKEKK